MRIAPQMKAERAKSRRFRIPSTKCERGFFLKRREMKKIFRIPMKRRSWDPVPQSKKSS